MVNPLEQWRKATTAPAWKNLPIEKKQQIRKDFLSKYSDAPEDARVGLTASTAFDTEELFNLPQFREADDDTKKKYLKGFLAANQGLKGEALDVFATVNLDKYYGSAAIAGLKMLPLGANQIKARVGRAIGTGDDEGVAYADAAVEETSRIAERAPGHALAAEVAANVALPMVTLPAKVVSKLPWLGRVAASLGLGGLETMATSPVVVKGGTPEERDAAFASEKKRQGIAGAFTRGVIDSATAPRVVEAVGDAMRWANPFSKTARVGDVADDVLQATKGRLTDAVTEVKPTRQAVLESIQSEKQALEAASETGFTGAQAGGKGLLDIQTGTPFTNPANIIQDQLAKDALPEVQLVKSRIGNLEQKAKEVKDSLWKGARESGVLSRNIPNGREKITPVWGKVLNTTEAADNAVASIPAVKNITDRLSAKDPITVDQIVTWQRELLEAKRTNPGAAGVLDRLSEQLKTPLSGVEAKKVSELFQKSQDLDEVADGVNKAVRFLKSPETPKEQLTRIFADETTRKPLQTAVAADITSVLNAAGAEAGARELALTNLYTKYADSSDKVRQLFKDDKDFLKSFDELMSRGKAAAQIKTAFKVASPEEASLGTRGLVAGTGAALTGARTAAAGGGFDLFVNRLNIKTRRLIRESYTDKKLAMDILNRAESLQQGRIDYAAMWDAMTGARGLGIQAERGLVGTGGDSVVAGDMPQEQPSTLEVPTEQSIEQLPTEQSTSQPSVAIDEAYNTLNLPNTLKQVIVDIAGIESTFGQNNDNPNSSAKGAWQFIDSTWDAVSAKAEQYLGRPLNRADVTDNFIAASILAKDNMEALRRANMKKSPENLYILHAFGERDGLKLLRNPQARAEDLVSEDVQKGHPLFFRNATTASEVVSNAKRYFQKKKAEAPDKRAELQTSLNLS